ncbi:MAG: nickel-responsive transcriptional regulator NikR [Gammaproteobacteria bacterium]|nr:nickel-responsive transcriptional regulator NikR [Gammaproteobacteria bacterium]
MSDLVRFGVSISGDLLEYFDDLIKRRGYSNRSEAIRDLIRERMVQEEWGTEQETVGTITIVYDHHSRDLSSNLTHIQHSFVGEIISVLHVHLDHNNCLEVLVVKGQGKQLQELSDQLATVRGVKYGRLTMATTGEMMPSSNGDHSHQGHKHDHK